MPKRAKADSLTPRLFSIKSGIVLRLLSESDIFSIVKVNNKTKGQAVKVENNPQVGTLFTHPTLGNVIVIQIHPLGTMDVRNIWTDRCYRITGLPMGGGQ